MDFTSASKTQNPIALTMGEPAGIGAEITLRAWQAAQQLHTPEHADFFIIDDPARLETVARQLDISVPISSISDPSEAASTFPHALPVLPVKDPDGALAHVELGKPSAKTAKSVLASIETAVHFSLAGKVSGIVTNPIQKAVLTEAGFPHPGHTEFLGALTAETTMHEKLLRGPVMMLSGEGLRTVPVTIHVPISKVSETLTADDIIRTSIVVSQGLMRDFGIKAPRLALTGLNPHAGEDGTIGTEEQTIIQPAIVKLRELGFDVIGPIPADSMFHEEARQNYSAAIAMYHDQALIPIKAIAFHSAVNVTLGLPIIRTSPDHGTALNIAGKGVAREDSLLSAIAHAHVMAKNRKEFDHMVEKTAQKASS